MALTISTAQVAACLAVLNEHPHPGFSALTLCEKKYVSFQLLVGFVDLYIHISSAIGSSALVSGCVVSYRLASGFHLLSAWKRVSLEVSSSCDMDSRKECRADTPSLGDWAED